MNSAYGQLSAGKFQGALFVHPLQLQAACPGSHYAWLKENDANILVTHHPIGWLTPDSETTFRNEIFDPQLFCLHLHGHMHRGKYRGESPAPGEVAHSYQSDSLFSQVPYWDEDGNKRRRKTGYCVIQLRFSDRDVFWRYRPRIFDARAREGFPEGFTGRDGWTECVPVGSWRNRR